MLGKEWDDSRIVISTTLAYTDVHVSTRRIEDASVRN